MGIIGIRKAFVGKASGVLCPRWAVTSPYSINTKFCRFREDCSTDRTEKISYWMNHRQTVILSLPTVFFGP